MAALALGVRLGRGGAPRNAGAALLAEPAHRSAVLDAHPAAGRLLSWDADPPSAERVGRYLAGGPFMPLRSRDFASLFAFNRPSAATDFGADGRLAELGADAIRQGYDPAALVPAGWLLEGASVNTVANSHNPSFTAGAGTNTAAVSADLPAPFGAAASVVKFTRGDPAVTTDNNCGNLSVGELAASTTYTVSCWLFVPQAYAGTVPIALNHDAGTNVAARAYDLAQKGTWQRVWRTFTTSATAGFKTVQMRPSSAAAGDHLYMALLMCEPGAGPPTSIIPTAGGPATRAADQLRIEGPAFAALFGAGAPQGCVVVDALLDANSGVARVAAQLDDGSNNNRLELRPITAGGSLSGIATAAGAQGTAALAGGVFGYGGARRLGLRWSGGGAFAVCLDGGALGVGDGAPSPFSALRLGVSATGANGLNGRLLRVRALAYAPSDAEFQALCATGG